MKLIVLCLMSLFLMPVFKGDMKGLLDGSVSLDS